MSNTNVVPILMFGAGALLIYGAAKNKSPLPLLGSLFGVTTGAASTTTPSTSGGGSSTTAPAPATSGVPYPGVGSDANGTPEEKANYVWGLTHPGTPSQS